MTQENQYPIDFIQDMLESARSHIKNLDAENENLKHEIQRLRKIIASQPHEENVNLKHRIHEIRKKVSELLYDIESQY